MADNPALVDAETLHQSLGLTDDEAADIASILGRQPNGLELAMYAVMWSEHCSYKSSRVHLGRLPTDGPEVLVGPGENAGVIDAGEGVAVAIRIESHNHPSAIEPSQGAATGVGGILRDIFTMGARPIAVMDPLRFGPLEDPRTRWIAEGVVAGISHYGNAVGVPTIGGEFVVDPCYQGNPLVNVLCLGLLPKERLVLGQASGVGNLAVLFGSSTGRDGIGGVSVLASAGFSDGDEEQAKRPSVQVGNPYEEKRLIEACLEVLDAGLVVGIQDLGGAGITCATSETASRGGVGMDVWVDQVHKREPGMEPFEVMTSESQERMLAIVTQENLERLIRICERWEITASVIGVVTDGTRLRVLSSKESGEVLADIPARSLHEDAPRYNRSLAEPADRAARLADAPTRLAGPLGPAEGGEQLLRLLAHPSIANTTWVSSQYDHMLFLNTVVQPGGDAAVLRLAAPGVPTTGTRGLALSTDGNHRWCAVDPRCGTALTVVESVLNVACGGARPVALVNCLNFGNPEHPEVMWQLSEAIDGMAEACRALGIPVVGGNVSLYNESAGNDIDPTPVVGTLGLIDELTARPPQPTLVDGGEIVLVGAASSDLTASLWADVVHGHRGGTLEAPDYGEVGALAAYIAREVASAGENGLVGLHDVAEGGLAVALAEMAVNGDTGVDVPEIDGHGEAFCERPGRVLVCTIGKAASEALVDRAASAGVKAEVLGTAGGTRITLGKTVDVGLNEAKTAWLGSLGKLMSQAAKH